MALTPLSAARLFGDVSVPRTWKSLMETCSQALEVRHPELRRELSVDDPQFPMLITVVRSNLCDLHGPPTLSWWGERAASSRSTPKGRFSTTTRSGRSRSEP